MNNIQMSALVVQNPCLKCETRIGNQAFPVITDEI